MRFLQTDFIVNWLKNFNIIFVTETHLYKKQIFDVKGFIPFHNAFTENDGVKKARGGLSCFIAPELMEYVKNVDRECTDNIFVTFEGGDTVFGSYIAPADSPYFNNEDFSPICNVIRKVDKKNVLIGGGDLNARIGDEKIKLPQQNYKYRINPDHIVNAHGEEVVQICESFKCYVLNNLDKGDRKFDGKFTFNKGGRTSQNDIIIANNVGLQNTDSFTIYDELNWNPSDHHPVSAEVEISISRSNIRIASSGDILTTAGEPEFRRRGRIKSERIDWEKYYNLIPHKLDRLQKKLETLEDETTLENLNTVIESLDNAFYKAAVTSTSNERPAGEAYCDKTSLDGDRSDVLKRIDAISRRKQIQMWNTITESKDPKVLWSGINWNGTSEGVTEQPDIDDLKKQFEMKSSTDDDSTLLCEVTGDSYVPQLDDRIDISEVIKGHESLKPDKSTGDRWVKQMIPAINLVFMTFLTTLMNIIFLNHLYPTLWRTTIVNAFYKFKGLRSMAKNYRGVTLVQLLSKLFDFVLLKRFLKWFVPADEQTAYTKGKSGSDHVFFMRCMSRYATKFKKKIFFIAIDFDGAFDRVSRSILIRKLILFGAGTVFTMCIAAIYMSTESEIFMGKEHRAYYLHAGIKQGLPLSPMLFLFYINDIFQFFEALHKGGTEILDKLNLLIHADDATLIATTREKAIAKLRTLLTYCNMNKIILQYTKCIFIAINGDETDRASLPFGETTIPNNDHIELLGSHLDESGNMKLDLERHYLKRYPSSVKYYNFLKSNVLAPLFVKLKVLEACVLSSLLHNCESFGNAYPTKIDKLYMKLIKSALKVRTSTPNELVLIETGLKPLKAIIYGREFNFYRKFKESLMVGGVRYQMMEAMMANPTDYIKHYMDLERRFESSEKIHEKFMEELRGSVRNKAEKERYKFMMYLKLNPELEKSPCLGSNEDPIVNDIIRFRLGSHYFPIETGRWCRKPRSERICGTCKVVGDEEHYVYHCPVLQRDGNMQRDFKFDWMDPEVMKLFKRMKEEELL